MKNEIPCGYRFQKMMKILEVEANVICISNCAGKHLELRRRVDFKTMK